VENKFENFLSDLRKENNLTQKELAELVHVSPSTISKWEKGIAKPSITLYEELAKALNVTSVELLYCKKGIEASPAVCLDEMHSSIKELILADQKRTKKVFLQKIIICVLAVALLLSVFSSVYLYYYLPPKMKIVDEFYDDAPEPLPYEKVYRVVVDYDGRITTEETIKYLAYVRSNYRMYFTEADAIIVTYHANYQGREHIDDYYAMAVAVPTE